MRMLDKSTEPTKEQIELYLGDSLGILEKLEDMLNTRYVLTKLLKFPFGANYGWGYKYSHRQQHICYAFFEDGFFVVTIQLGDEFVTKLNTVLQDLSEKGKKIWEKRYPCGMQGGWIHYPVITEEDLNDVIIFVEVKKKPLKRKHK